MLQCGEERCAFSAQCLDLSSSQPPSQESGKAITLATGSRNSTALPVLGCPVLAHICGSQAASSGAELPMAVRDRTCVARCLMHLDVLMPLIENVQFETVPTLLSASGDQFTFQKPAKWGFPGFLTKGGSICTENSVEKFSRFADVDSHFILRVHITEPDTSLHAIAVRNRMLIDPAFGVWKPLCVELFQSLLVDRIEAGFRIKWK